MYNIEDMLGKMTEFLKTEAKTETIIGQPFTLGEYTCVPVMALGMGFGGGGGEGKASLKQTSEGEGAGGGAGMGMGPVGFLVTRGTEILFIPAHTSRGLSAAIEKLPDLMDKFMEKNKQREPALS